MIAYGGRHGIRPSARFAVRLRAITASRAPVWRVLSNLPRGIYVGTREMSKSTGIGTLRKVSKFFRQRAGTAKPKDLVKFLRRAPKVAPIRGNERA